LAERADRAEPGPSGVLVVDKPGGMTSHDVVARLRKVLRTRQIGHAGTLDPMATGVLVVAVGEATKLVPWLTADDKAYAATIRLGVTTETLDRDGKETGQVPVPVELRAALVAAAPENAPPVARALAAERARREQIPPAYSAIRIDGERAHVLARAGRLEAPLPPRPVEVRELALVGARVDGDGDGAELDVRVEAAKGYFVRSLARDLALGLGTVGHLTSLRRLRSGAFALDEARSLDAVRPGDLLPLAQAAAKALPSTILDADGERAARFGQRVPLAALKGPHPRPSAWLDEAGALVAIGQCDADGGRVLRGFGR
jgi:tRNA pseudouridine55 synthase